MGFRTVLICPDCCLFLENNPACPSFSALLRLMASPDAWMAQMRAKMLATPPGLERLGGLGFKVSSSVYTNTATHNMSYCRSDFTRIPHSPVLRRRTYS